MFVTEEVEMEEEVETETEEMRMGDWRSRRLEVKNSAERFRNKIVYKGNLCMWRRTQEAAQILACRSMKEHEVDPNDQTSNETHFVFLI